MVWGAPTSCSSGGRSAVHTSSGTPAWWASTTAGWKLDGGRAAGAQDDRRPPVARPRPRARKPALRSSWWTWTAMRASAGEGEGQRRRAGAGHTTACGHPGPRPLVDEGGAEGGLGQAASLTSSAMADTSPHR